MSQNDANRLTLYNLHLSKRKESKSVFNIIDDLVGLHASRFKSPIFSIAGRSKSGTINSVHKELYQSDDLLRIRCMRGTLHILDLKNAIICHKVTFEQRMKTCNYLKKRMKIKDRDYSSYCNLIMDSLQDSPKEIRILINDIILRQGHSSVSDVRALKLTIRILWEKGLLLRSNNSLEWDTENPKYSINSNKLWMDGLNSITKGEAEDILIKKYFKSYGPATISDASWWSGMNMKRIAKIISNNADELIEIKLEGCDDTYILNIKGIDKVQTINRECQVNLLAFEDNLLKGYKISRKRFVNPHYLSKVYNAAGEANASVLVNGKVLGIWKFNKMSNTIRVSMFEALPEECNEYLIQELEWISSTIGADYILNTTK